MQDAMPRRQVGFVQAASIIVGTVIGSGIFISLPIVARASGSPGMNVVIWFLGGLLWVPQVLVLAELGTAYPLQGGPYYYIHRAGSPFLGFLYTWTAFLTSDTPTLTIVSLGAILALEVFSPVFVDPVTAKLLAAVLIALFTVVHCRSVRTGGNVQILLTITKLTPLAAIVLAGFWFLSPGDFSFTATAPEAQDKGILTLLLGGVSSTLWSYAGFTNILYMAGEVKRPERTLPVAMIGGLAFVTLAYTLIALSTSAIVPFEDLCAAGGGWVNPFLYVPAVAGAGGVIFAVAVFISMLGVLNAGIMSQPRLEYGMARDGLFFSVFGRLHPRFLTPHYSIIIQSGLAILMLIPGGINDLLGYFTISYALQNALVYGALVFLRRRADYRPTYRAPGAVVLALLAILTQIAVGVGSFLAYPAAGVMASLFLIGSGLPIYLYFYTRTRKGQREDAAPGTPA